MRKIVIGCLVGLLGGAGCAVDPGDAGDPEAVDPPAQASVAQSIQGGAVESGTPSVGFLRILRNYNGSVFYDACTATLISPVVVLTAAHCLPRPGTGDSLDGFYTGPGSPVAPGQLPANLTWHGISSYLVYPGDTYHPGAYDFSLDMTICPAAHIDLGLVRLAQPINGVGMYDWQHFTAAVQGNSCTTIGYGLHGTSYGEKYAAQDTLDSTPGPTWYTAPSSTGLVVRWNSGDNGIADHGDSGGPLVCNTQWGWMIAGTVSCHNEDVDVRAPGGTETYAPIFEQWGQGPSVWIEYYWCTWTGYLCYV